MQGRGREEEIGKNERRNESRKVYSCHSLDPAARLGVATSVSGGCCLVLSGVGEALSKRGRESTEQRVQVQLGISRYLP